MKVRNNTFKLGIAVIVIFWTIVIIIAIRNIDTTMWGVGMLIGVILSIAASFYVYTNSIDPVDDDVSSFYTAMVTNINSQNVPPGKCLYCNRMLGPTNTISTSCDHQFHRTCYFSYNDTNPKSKNGVYFCPLCFKMVESQTATCYTGDDKEIDEVNIDELIDINIDSDSEES